MRIEWIQKKKKKSLSIYIEKWEESRVRDGKGNEIFSFSE